MAYPIPLVGFVAASGTGKTTLLRRVVPLLVGEGLRIGYLKHAHHGFDLDSPGKDSYEVREAGAVQTLIASDQRWALQARQAVMGRDPDLGEMLRRFDASALDLVLVEGFKHAVYPKIEVYRSVLGHPPLYPDDTAILAVAADGPLPGGAPPRYLPIDEPQVVAEFVLQCLRQGRLDGPTRDTGTPRRDPRAGA